jgi:hypothetical protein
MRDSEPEQFLSGWALSRGVPDRPLLLVARLLPLKTLAGILRQRGFFDSYWHSTIIANGNEGALAVNRSGFVLDASV